MHIIYDQKYLRNFRKDGLKTKPPKSYINLNINVVWQ